MNAKEFLHWLDTQNLLTTAKNHSVYFKKVLQQCLNVTDEDFLIISDTGFENHRLAPIVAGAYYFAAKDLNINTGIVIQEAKNKGEKADPTVIRELQNLNRKNVIAMALSNKLGSMKEIGTSFRNYSYENYHRFASATSLGKLNIDQLPNLISTINVDYDKLKSTGDKIKERMDKGKELRVTTEAGTDLYIKIERKEAINNCGIYTKPRTGGNIPAGEVYTAPRWKNVEGTVVIDASSAQKDGTHLVKTPITLKIEKDEVQSITGGKEAEGLQNTIDWAYNKAKHPWGIKRVGEFGIGINPNAEITGSMIIDEKTKGTSHIAIGSNYWFGGTIYAIIHLDQVFRNPKIYIDNELITY